MNKAYFQNHIVKNEGYILSDGTLQIDMLLSTAYDLMVTYDMNKDLRNEILGLFVVDDKSFEEPLSLDIERFYGNAHVHEQKMDDAHFIWNEDLYNFFNEIAPNDYHFGSSEGDGSLIGWFKYEEEGEFDDN